MTRSTKEGAFKLHLWRFFQIGTNKLARNNYSQHSVNETKLGQKPRTEHDYCRWAVKMTFKGSNLEKNNMK